MTQTAEAQAATDARLKEQEAARDAYEAQVKAEEEAAAKAAEGGAAQFIVSTSGMAGEKDALAAFDTFVNAFDNVYGSIVIGGLSHDVSEFKPEPEEAAPEATPAPAPAKAETK